MVLNIFEGKEFWTYFCFNKVAKGRTGFEPLRFVKEFAKFLHALVEGHLRNGLLIQNVQQIF